MIGLDTETHLMGPGNMDPTLVCVSTSTPSLHLRDEGVRVAREALRGHVVTHNGAYDWAVLVRAGLEIELVFEAMEAGRVHDTMVREQLLGIAEGNMQFRRVGSVVTKRDFSLDGLARHYLGEQLDKGDDGWRLRYAELDGVPLAQWPERAREYAVTDAVTTLAVYHAQGDASPDEARQVGAAFALHLMSVRGLVTDPEQLRAVRERLVTEQEGLREELVRTGLIKPNPRTAAGFSRDTKAVKGLVEAAFRAQGRAPPLTPKGAVRTDKDTLDQVAGHPELHAYVRFGYTQKVLSTYVDGLDAPVVNARFNALVESGRTSSSGPGKALWAAGVRGANLQNLPREDGIREIIVPRPGYVFAACDYDSMELRTLSQVLYDLLGRSTMGDAYRADPDADPHSAVAAELLGITYAEALARKDEPEVFRARQTGKVANFGIPGGLGVSTLVTYARTLYGLVISEAQARSLKDLFLRLNPEMADYFAHVNRLDGRMTQLRSGRVRGGASFCAAANSYFQGLAADAAKCALWFVTRACRTGDGPLRGSYPVVFVHDELILEVPEDRAHEAACALAETMVQAGQMFVPDVPLRATAALMRRWTKGAKPKYLNGRLVC